MQFAPGGLFTAASVPGSPVSGHVALFGFHVLTLGVSRLICLLARDARPESGWIRVSVPVRAPLGSAGESAS